MERVSMKEHGILSRVLKRWLGATARREKEKLKCEIFVKSLFVAQRRATLIFTHVSRRTNLVEIKFEHLIFKVRHWCLMGKWGVVFVGIYE